MKPYAPLKLSAPARLNELHSYRVTVCQQAVGGADVDTLAIADSIDVWDGLRHMVKALQGQSGEGIGSVYYDPTTYSVTSFQGTWKLTVQSLIHTSQDPMLPPADLLGKAANA